MLSNGTPTLRSLNSFAVLLAASGSLDGSGVDGVNSEDLVGIGGGMRGVDGDEVEVKRRWKGREGVLLVVKGVEIELKWRLKRVRRRRLRKRERVVRMACVYMLVGQ